MYVISGIFQFNSKEMIFIIEINYVNNNISKSKIIDRKEAEKILNHLNVNEVITLAYQYWSLDKKKGIVALDLVSGKLFGYSERNDVKNRRSTINLEIIVFELDDCVDVDDVTILLGNSGVKGLRSYFQIDDETFSSNMVYWTEKYMNTFNMTINELRNKFITVLFNDYKQVFHTSLKNQLDNVY